MEKFSNIYSMSSSSYMYKRHTFGLGSITFEGMQQFHLVFTDG